MIPYFYEKRRSAYGFLLTQFRRYCNTTIALTTISIASLFALAPTAYRDYKTFMSYGPGGVPYNAFGWLMVTVVLRPMTSEMFSTDVYEGQADKRSWLPEKELQRKGERPIVGPHAAPQRQLSQVPGKDVQEKLVAAFDDLYRKNQDLVKFSPSLFEKHTDALFLVDNISNSPIQSLREISHIHGTSDHSVHVTLSPVDCKKVIRGGWGQRHPLDGSKLFKRLTGMWLPNEYIYIYAPRDDEEIETVMQIVKASVAYMTGSNEVR